MKRLLLLAVLLAAPLAAQTGDCAAETGTTTQWELLSGGAARYTYYAAGLTGVTQTVFGGISTVAQAEAFCDNADDSRVADELLAARLLVEDNATAQTVQPAYPEVCANTCGPGDNLQCPAPANAGGTTIQNCRKASFHQQLIREVWPEDALVVHMSLYRIFDWLNRNNQQGGAAFNTTQKQNWLGVTGTQWTNQVNPRMNNQDAIASGLLNDPQWQGELE